MSSSVFPDNKRSFGRKAWREKSQDAACPEWRAFGEALIRGELFRCRVQERQLFIHLFIKGRKWEEII